MPPYSFISCFGEFPSFQPKTNDEGTGGPKNVERNPPLSFCGTVLNPENSMWGFSQMTNNPYLPEPALTAYQHSVFSGSRHGFQHYAPHQQSMRSNRPPSWKGNPSQMVDAGYSLPWDDDTKGDPVLSGQTDGYPYQPPSGWHGSAYRQEVHNAPASHVTGSHRSHMGFPTVLPPELILPPVSGPHPDIGDGAPTGQPEHLRRRIRSPPSHALDSEQGGRPLWPYVVLSEGVVRALTDEFFVPKETYGAQSLNSTQHLPGSSNATTGDTRLTSPSQDLSVYGIFTAEEPSHGSHHTSDSHPFLTVELLLPPFSDQKVPGVCLNSQVDVAIVLDISLRHLELLFGTPLPVEVALYHKKLVRPAEMIRAVNAALFYDHLLYKKIEALEQASSKPTREGPSQAPGELLKNIMHQVRYTFYRTLKALQEQILDKEIQAMESNAPANFQEFKADRFERMQSDLLQVASRFHAAHHPLNESDPLFERYQPMYVS